MIAHDFGFSIEGPHFVSKNHSRFGEGITSGAQKHCLRKREKRGGSLAGYVAFAAGADYAAIAAWNI
jgi:hypothetical protein